METGEGVRFQTLPCPQVTLGIALASLALSCRLTTLPAQLLNHPRARQALQVALECALDRRWGSFCQGCACVCAHAQSLSHV